VAATAIVATVMAVFRNHESDQQPDLPAALADAPDLHMVDATILQYGEDGNLSYRLAAKTIRHFEADGLTRLNSADLLVQNSDEPPWRIAAEEGEIRITPAGEQHAEEVVLLRENVRMEQKYPDGRFVRVETPSIDYYPDRQYAETSRNVMIDTDVGRTMAVGLQGELRRGLLNLFSSDTERVHTIVLRRQFR